MEEFGMFEAKTRFSEIARWVMATGKSVRVTMRGRPGVRIVPDQPDEKLQRRRQEALAELRRIRKQMPPTTIEQIKADIAEGRM